MSYCPTGKALKSSYLLLWVSRMHGIWPSMAILLHARLSSRWPAKPSPTRRRRCIPLQRHCRSWPPRHPLRHRRLLELHKSVLNRPDQLRVEHGPCVKRSGHRLRPRLEHLLHPPPDIGVRHRVRFHIRLEEVPAEVEGIRGADILDDRVEHVQCGEFLIRCGLRMCQRYALHPKVKEGSRFVASSCQYVMLVVSP